MERRCEQCGAPLPATAGKQWQYCGELCRALAKKQQARDRTKLLHELERENAKLRQQVAYLNPNVPPRGRIPEDIEVRLRKERDQARQRADALELQLEDTAAELERVNEDYYQLAKKLKDIERDLPASYEDLIERTKNTRELQEQTSELRGLLRETARNAIEITNVDMQVCGGLGDALHWKDVPSLVRDVCFLVTANLGDEVVQHGRTKQRAADLANEVMALRDKVQRLRERLEHIVEMEEDGCEADVLADYARAALDQTKPEEQS